MKEVPRLISEIKEQNVLTIGDTKGFLKAGGVINFVNRPGRVKFQINKSAADKAGVKISSALVGLADKVVE